MEGWAYKADERERMLRVRERYAQLKAMEGWKITSSYPMYAETKYEGICPDGVTAEDVVIYCDGGNACFGGLAIINAARSFRCEVYTN